MWLAVSYFLTFAFPAWLGLRGWDVFFAGLLCFVPVFFLAYVLVFQTIPPKYVRKRETFTTLFQAHH